MDESVLMLSKLIPPRFGTGIIARPRLIELVKDFQDCQVLMVTAPAGYGKTVFLSQLRTRWAKPTVWYQLDEHDNDPVAFFQYLAAGIHEHYPGFGENIAKPVFNKDLTKDPAYLAGNFLNALIRLPEIVMVMDDYHIITDPAIQDFVYQLVHRVPPQLRLIISSRNVPPWNLSRAKLSGGLKTIGVRELRFNRQELEGVMVQNKIKTDPELIRDIETRSDGWPLAVSLLLQTMLRGKTDAEADLTADVFHYLASEILDKQTEPIRRFLLATSILEEVTPEFCDLLLERRDCLQILKTLAKEHCFLTPLQGKKYTYRYHPLFREFLTQQLGAERSEYLQRAGRALEQTGARLQAVEYYLAAQDYPSAIKLMKQGGRQAINLGHWQTVSRWLDTLPPEDLWTDPWLALYRAEILIIRGSLTAAEGYLVQAGDEFTIRDDRSGYQEVLIQQARLLRFQGRYRESLALLDQALPSPVKGNTGERFHLTLEQTINLAWSGQLTEAEVLLKEAIRAAESEQNEFILAHLAEGLANIYYMKGDYLKSSEWYRRSETGSPDPVLTGYIRRNNKALIYLEWGELDRALDYAGQDVAFKERLELTEALPLSYLQLGMVHLERRDLTSAGEYIGRAVAILEKSGGERIFLALGRAVLTRHFMMQNKISEARMMLNHAMEAAAGQSEYILAICQVIGAPVLFLTGEAEAALSGLEKAVATLEQAGARYFQMMGAGILAAAYFRGGNREKASMLAEQCLQWAAWGHYIQFFCGAYPVIEPVLRFGLEEGVEVPLINRILVHHGPGSWELLQDLARHPDPQVRRRIIVPLWEIAAPGAKALLEELAGDPALEVREQAQRLANRFQSGAPSAAVEGARPFIRIETLGPLRIFAGPTEISSINWRMKKTRDLLIYLYHMSEPVTRERIVEALWPEVDIQKGSQNFHTALHYLRRILANGNQNNEFITYGGEKYQLQPSGYESDRFRFENLLRLAGSQGVPAEEKLRLFEEAVALYRGDYLEELDYEWIIPERERLRQLYCNTRRLLASFYREQGDLAQSALHWRILLQYNPYSEQIAGQLMTVCAASGDWTGLGECYRQFTLQLKTELELTPSGEFRRLYQQLAGEKEV